MYKNKIILLGLFTYSTSLTRIFSSLIVRKLLKFVFICWLVMLNILYIFNGVNIFNELIITTCADISPNLTFCLFSLKRNISLPNMRKRDSFIRVIHLLLVSREQCTWCIMKENVFIFLPFLICFILFDAYIWDIWV